MEAKFNFKSAICTDRNQSERLLALGLKKETADMYMTRREEIEQQAMQVGGVHPDWDALECFRVGYKEGAKWADKTIIDKACEYLRQSLYNMPIFEHDEDETPVNYVCASCCDSVEEFVENFRRAIEE